MSHAVAISQQDASQFGENSVRLKIVCNGLRAFANQDQGIVGTAAEAKSLAAFFRDELPELMRENEAILSKAIRAQGKGEHEEGAVLDIMREDHERLAELVTDVIKGLRSASRAPDRADPMAINRAISAYLVALQSHTVWSGKIIYDKDAES